MNNSPPFDPCTPRRSEAMASSSTLIDLWLVHYKAIVDAELLGALQCLLNSEERQRQQRFHFDDDRKRFLLTRATVRTVLSRYAPVAPQDWIFSANSFGRPAIANAHPQAPDLDFNLSHTSGLIVLGVCRGRKLGVDVENIRTRKPSPGIAERFFAPEESTALANLAEELRSERFFAYWTLKEAYIKARGRGLSIPLDRFRFFFPSPDRIHFSIDADLEDDADRWRLWQFCHDDYLLAVCTEHRDLEAPNITCRRLVPTVAEEAIHIPLYAASAGIAG